MPSAAEQSAIVKYLGHAHTRIDRAIAAKRRLIVLLEEQKQAIIHSAVTRGLELSVPLTDSGVPWLGDIPSHWTVRRAGALFREVVEKSVAGDELSLSMSQKLGLVPSDQVERTLSSESMIGGKLCEPNDVVLNRLKAHLGVFALARHSGVVSPDYTVLRPTSLADPQYFEYVLRSQAVRRELRIRAKGIVEGFWRLYTNDFYTVALPVPPIAEQRAIVEFLSANEREVGTFVRRITQEIDLLREFRARLTSDVVTGQIDVRMIAASLPDLPGDAVASIDDEVDDEELMAPEPELAGARD
ncbi:restriction endonuclease subunit S [Microbacterium salsuginis]|uniref:restriction endonuclease subunit S n=1 Tax=Microbacterium salsuginis TaxID=2722803 RepID=UPI00197C7CA4|nr:restriction endonuclease subunit S [Microbacterium sp. CFH 90308]